MIPPGTLRGEVAEFDEAAGLGTVRAQDGAMHPFHCTAVADGSRAIAVGTEVTFRLLPARGGRIEAVELVSR